MTIFEAIAHGVVQGLTEFLPISSSGHLILLRFFFGWEDPGLAFDVALHWGTLLGVVWYFRKDLLALFTGFIRSFRGARDDDARMPWMIILGTIPAAMIGLLFEDHAETVFRSPWVIAVTLPLFGLLLYAVDRRSRSGASVAALTWLGAFLIGASQGIAVVPGVSRSGISITAALLVGLSRPGAVRFSFLLSMPIIFGAGVLKLGEIGGHLGDPIFWTGIMSAAVAGYAAVSFLLHFVKSHSFTPFVMYRVALAAVIIGWLLSQRGAPPL